MCSLRILLTNSFTSLPVKPTLGGNTVRLCCSCPQYLYSHTGHGLELLPKDTMVVHEELITEEEESSLMKEIEPYFKRTKYESSHWDHVCHIFVTYLSYICHIFVIILLTPLPIF